MKKNYGRRLRREAHFKDRRFERHDKQHQNEVTIQARNEAKLARRAEIVRGKS